MTKSKKYFAKKYVNRLRKASLESTYNLKSEIEKINDKINNLEYDDGSKITYDDKMEIVKAMKEILQKDKYYGDKILIKESDNQQCLELVAHLEDLLSKEEN